MCRGGAKESSTAQQDIDKLLVDLAGNQRKAVVSVRRELDPSTCPHLCSKSLHFLHGKPRFHELCACFKSVFLLSHIFWYNVIMV